MTQEKFNVVCIKWGDKYPVEYANRLYQMVKRFTTVPFDFYCFTDDSKGLDPEIIAKLMPVMHVAPEDNKYAYRKEAGLCDDNLGGLNGQRVLFFDLDIVILDNIDCFFTYPQGDDFVIINDWNSWGNKVGQASCYSWRVGTLGSIKKYFEDHPKEVVAKHYTASQEYLSEKVIEKYRKLKFWPSSWCRSFRYHSMPVNFLRPFMTPKKPNGCKILVFHGDTDPHLALKGTFSERRKVPWHKRWYKTLKPATWLKDYWK